MNNLKKILAVSIASIAMLSIFASCNKKEEAPDVEQPAVTDDAVVEETAEAEEDIDAPADTSAEAEDVATESTDVK